MRTLGAPARHLAPLDGLRGVAILLVFLMHAVVGLIAPATAFDAGVRDVAGAGWIGVDLFFVLSGFLITGVLLDSRAHPCRWRNFFARRVLRIFPLYYGLLVVLFVVLPGFWSDPKFTALQSDQAWYWGYAVNVLAVVKQEQWVPLSTQHFWAVAVEQQFYLLWPFVVWSCRPQTLVRVTAGFMVAGLAFRLWLTLADPFHTTWGAYVLTPARLDPLMMGALLAVAARREGALARLRAAVPWVVGAGALTLAGMALLRGGLPPKDPVIVIAGYPVIALVLGGVLVAALTRGRLARGLENRVLQSLGKYSYGLYVLHLPIIGALQWKGVTFYEYGATWLGGSQLPALLLFAALAGTLSYGAAWLSYHLYEKHFLALKRYFEAQPISSVPAPSRSAPSDSAFAGSR